MVRLREIRKELGVGTPLSKIIKFDDKMRTAKKKTVDSQNISSSPPLVPA